MKTSHPSLLIRLLALRLIMSAIAGAALFFAWIQHLALPLAPMVIVVSVSVGSVVVHAWRLRLGWQAGEADLALQLLQDMLTLVLLLYFSGGVGNPFVCLLLFPLAIACTLLSRPWVWLMLGAALAACLVLLIEYQPLPDIKPDVMRLATALSFLLTALLTVGCVSWLNQYLRRHEAGLARLRENAQHQEQVLGVATLATGVAQTLGAPLNTLGVLINERLADGPAIEARADLLLMHEQVQDCRNVLARLLIAAREHTETRVPIRQTLQQLFTCWRATRPQIRLLVHWPDTRSPESHWSPVLDHALLKLFNNAADTSPEPISISISWGDLLVLTIDDAGTGPSSAMLETTPSPVNDTDGMWFSNASLERFGARVSYSARSGGHRTTVEIPLRTLEQNNGSTESGLQPLSPPAMPALDMGTANVRRPRQ